MIVAHDIDVRRGPNQVLDGIDLTVPDEHIVGVVGPNGSGKSTLIQALYRALPATGQICFDDIDIATLTRREIATRVSVLTQDRGEPMPITVQDAVLLGRLPHQTLHQYGDRHDLDQVSEALELVKLSGFENRLLSQLSGGERQRVSIARAIAQDTKHLLLDEPTNHLDIHHQLALLKLIKQLAKTTVIVLHDLNLAARVCDSLILLNSGKLVASGTPQDVLTPDLIGSVYQVSVTRHNLDGRPVLTFDP